MATNKVQPSAPKHEHAQDLATLVAVLTGVVTVGAMYLAREVLIPLALAVLISFVLAPLAHGLRRLGVPRAPAVIAVVMISFGAVLGVGALGTTQITQLGENLPQYQAHLRDKIRTLRGSTTDSGAVAKATSVIQDLGQKLAGGAAPVATAPALTAGSLETAPIAVEVRSTGMSPFAVATDYMLAIFSPLASTFLVVLLVIFLLLQQEDLRDRTIKLLGPRELHCTTEAMQEAASGLSRYFLLQTLLNALSGVIVGIGLWLIGVPSPVLWGIFTMLMRYVPYVGAIIAGVLPVALAAAVDPGWSMVIATALLFIVSEGVIGQLVELQIYGRQTGLSPLAIVVSATFWTWLWGPIGLILATPLTMCLVILGQYTRRLESLRVLLGDQPALTAPESFYQRLIAGDPADVIDQADKHLKTASLADYCSTVALPGLVLAQRDASSGALSDERQATLADGVAELIDGLDDPVAPEPPDGSIGGPVQLAIVCLGGRSTIDRAAAALFVDVLRRDGVAASVGSDVGPPGLVALKAMNPEYAVVCLSYVGSARATQVRTMVRRVRRVFPSAKVLVGLWLMAPNDPEWVLVQEVDTDAKLATTFPRDVGICPSHLT